MLSRRQFLKLTFAGGGALIIPTQIAQALGPQARAELVQTLSQNLQSAQILDGAAIAKFQDPLVIPPAFSPATIEQNGQTKDSYHIAVRQFQQQILPQGMPQTTVWGYGRAGDPLPGQGASTYNSPAFTIEARKDVPVRIQWSNQLVDDPNSDSPNHLPHLLPIDTSLHWANPANSMHTDGSEGYTGPVPIASHLHGGHTPAQSDGHPDAWILPNAASTSETYTRRGAVMQSLEEVAEGDFVYEYPNDQPGTTLWFHDHALGITRLNVYAGLAGFYLLRDEVEAGLNLPGPAPSPGDPVGIRYYEIPIAIQDRIFNEDGSFFYPDSRAFFDGYEGPFKPETPVSPIWNPEFFGNTMMVNGRTWPYLEVEPRLYRLRFLNGCNSRFLVLKFDRDLNFHQIGGDGGLLSGSPVTLDQLLMAPGERADVIVDFSSLAVGDEVVLLNLGPDEPFGGLPVDPEIQAKPDSTGQVMLFRVVPLTMDGQRGEIPRSLPSIDVLQADAPARTLTLNEEMFDPADIPVGALLGTNFTGPQRWSAETTEVIKLGDTEVWNLVNLTVDAHPIHLHLVQFQVIDRTPIRELNFHEEMERFIREGAQGTAPDPMNYVNADARMPESWESGWKDTVIAYPGEVTRIIARFDLPGLYVWHCHILEHEDNEMMRPFIVEE